MVMSENKSIFLEYGVSEDTVTHVQSFLPFEVKQLDVGFKYLGYFLNPNNYLKEDWMWLIKKVEKKIG